MPCRGGSVSRFVVSRRRSGAALTGAAEHCPVRTTVSASAATTSAGSPSWWSGVVCRRAVGSDAAEEVALAERVAQRERHRVEDLVAERDAVLTHRLAVRRVAHRRHRDEGTQGVDHELARRRRAARGDDDEALQRQRVVLVLEPRHLVAEGIARSCGSTRRRPAPRCVRRRSGWRGAGPPTPARRRCSAGRAPVRSHLRHASALNASSSACGDGVTKLRKKR